ncbi:hypothetical protein L204_102682 [Cryptococcus depauperatus]|nr:hypothetical protein L204_00566 [Cryptococcus depauperatus CBS 7855]
MAQRTNKELYDGANVNLGVGIPVLAANYLPEDMKVCVQSENGLLGMRSMGVALSMLAKRLLRLFQEPQPLTLQSFFGMIRGGHVDVSIFGAMEVSADGDLVNYMIP